MVRMMFFVKGILARIVIGSLILFSVLAALFPEKVGLVVGLVIGVIIMVMEQTGLKMGSLAIEFAKIIEGINLLQSIQILGFLMIIIIGLVAIWFLPRNSRI